jgi:hypothetical protein
MKQREHAVLNNFTVLKNLFTAAEGARGPSEKRAKLPKKRDEATRVFAFCDCGEEANKREERGFFDAFRS